MTYKRDVLARKSVWVGAKDPRNLSLFGPTSARHNSETIFDSVPKDQRPKKSPVDRAISDLKIPCPIPTRDIEFR